MVTPIQEPVLGFDDGIAITEIDGSRHELGASNSAEAKEAFERLVDKWENTPRTLNYLQKILPRTESGGLVSRMSLTRWMSRGLHGHKLPHVRVGKRLYSTVRDLRNWLAVTTEASMPQAEEQRPQTLGVSDAEFAEVGLNAPQLA